MKPAALIFGISLLPMIGSSIVGASEIEGSAWSYLWTAAVEAVEGPALILAQGDTLVRNPYKGIVMAESVEVDRMVLCAAVKDRTPIGVADTFPADIYAVYCFTRILGARDTATVVHSWLRKGKKLSNVELSVRSPIWRTWSRKKMRPDLKGEWEVKVIGPDGKAIASKKFFLK
jgi:hypothetical protein